MAYLRGRYNGGAFTNSNRRNDVRHYRSVHSWTSSSGLRRILSSTAYITSVSYRAKTGTDRLVRRIKRFAAKSRSKKMVEINNQRKAFLDMLAWSEELITGMSENQKSWL